MFRYSFLLTVILLIAGCQTTEPTVSTAQMKYTASENQNGGSIRGKILDPETGEGVAFATVKLMLNEEVKAGSYTDEEGMFQIKNIEPGMYDVLVEYLGYSSLRLKNIEVQAGKILDLEGQLGIQEVELKPMIYLYPTENIEVEVNLIYDGKLTHTYPKSEGNWSVNATTDGNLTDANGRRYYGLFWEGIPNERIVPNCGTIVSKDSLIPFLESSLDQLGLNYKEANEFIVFWLPILEQHPYHLIYFAGNDYTDHAELNISPKPDNLIRVMMGYVPLKTPVEIEQQVLPIKPVREGFTVVEWGGTKCSLPNS